MRRLLRQFLATTLTWAVCLFSISASANENAYREATRLYQQAQWQQAAELFAECASDTANLANRSAANFYLGECLMQLGDYAVAQQHYQNALKNPQQLPQADRALFRAGESAWFSGDLPEAKKQLTKYVEQYPQGDSLAYAKQYLHEIAATTQMSLGQSQYDAGNYDAAIATFREAQDLAGNGNLAERSHLAIGWSLWKLQRYDVIQAELQSLAENSRLAVEYHYLLGMASYGQSEWASATNHLQQAVQNANDHANLDAILFYLGESYFRSQNREAATKWFQQLIARYPTSKWCDDAQQRLTKTVTPVSLISPLNKPSTRNNLDPKLHLIEESLLYPTGSSPADLLLDEAVGLERDGRFDPAIAAYHELIEKHPGNSAHQEALKRSARLHQKLAQYSRARELFKTYLTSYADTPSHTKVLAELAWIEDRLGNRPEAAKAFIKLHAEFPQSPQAATAAYWLALQAADKKDNKQATHYVDWLLKNHAASPTKQTRQLWEQSVCLKCQLAASDNDWQTIQKLLHETRDQINEKPTQARAAFWQAEAEFRLENYKQARIAFEKLTLQVAGLSEPWIAMVPLRQAQLTARRQQWTETLKLLDQLEQQHPHFELDYEADYLRGRALAGRAQMSDARESYDKVLANPKATNTETAAMAQWMIGETFFHQYDYPRAREVYLKVIDQHTQPEWQARAALQAGKCWELEGDWEKAKALYTTALKRWTGSDSEKKLQTRLKWADSQITKTPSTKRL